MADDTKKTVIEHGTDVDGTITSQRPIILSGNLKGQVTAPSLDVMAGGTVKGKVRVSQFCCRGEVSGEVIAESVELSGKVCDATVIRAKTLDVKLAQSEGGVEVSFGNCELQVGELPARPSGKTSTSSSDSSKSNADKVSNDVVEAVSQLMK